MTIDCQLSEKHPAQLATARFDRESAAATRVGWLNGGAARVFSVAPFQIPVGFEDESGFHLGVPAGKPTANFRLEKTA